MICTKSLSLRKYKLTYLLTYLLTFFKPSLIYAAKIFNRKRIVYCAGFDLLYLDINANKLYLFEFCILRSFHLVRCHGLKSKSAVVLTSRNGL